MNNISKYKLDTPCLVIDKLKLVANIKAMQKYASSHKKLVRPHAKTHKCTQVAKLQLELGAVGICVAKVSEALEFAKNGITGLLITSPVVTTIKLNNLVEVLNLAPDTMVVIDSFDNLKQLSELAQTKNLAPINIIVEIDAGISRTGISFEKVVPLALEVHKSDNLILCGIQCYAGHYQHIKDNQARTDASVSLLQKAGLIKQEIEKQTGLQNLIQTGSGTGTYEIDCQIDSVTEIQPGSYTVMDKEYFDIEYDGVYFQPSMTMLTTVISANSKEHVTVDAGTKSLYKDPTSPKIISHAGLSYDWDLFGDEHGKVTGSSLPVVGDLIEMIVPHCDPTINLFDKFYVIENDVVVDIWDIGLRGKSQ